MVIKKAELETVCGVTSILPDNSCPEAAFAGRSNVGKSTLINGLMNRRALARVSSKPGKTQTINYYKVNDQVYIVDLPGYGYANASEKVKAGGGKMIERYLRTSRQLRMVFLLVDIRHDPTKDDVHMYRWIVENGFYPAVIATKLDKIKKSQVSKHLKAVRQVLDLPEETPLIPWSAETKEGRDQIWALIEQYVMDGEGQQ